MKINKIVVPVDLGKQTEKLADFARFMGRQLSAEIIFCHVVEPIYSGDMMLGGPSLDEFEARRRAGAEERIANLIKDTVDEGLKSNGTVLFGDTVDEIIGYAKHQQAEMVIIGTHGAKGLEKILIGSVADRVLKRVYCPCLVMNPYRKIPS
jgi:nucleotide-binding universal stress UspA family protein